MLCRDCRQGIEGKQSASKGCYVEIVAGVAQVALPPPCDASTDHVCCAELLLCRCMHREVALIGLQLLVTATQRVERTRRHPGCFIVLLGILLLGILQGVARDCLKSKQGKAMVLHCFDVNNGPNLCWFGIGVHDANKKHAQRLASTLSELRFMLISLFEFQSVRGTNHDMAIAPSSTMSNSWRKYKVKTRGLDPSPTAPAQSKCCLPVSTNVEDITETDFPGAPASRERWYILVMISKKKQTNHMHEFRILCSHFVHIMFASGAH